MFNRLCQFLLLSLCVFFTTSAFAIEVEAQGQAVIVNGDLASAREAAIEDASRQASMQAAVYVSSSQQVRDGILEIDDMKITTLGEVRNIELLSEQRAGNILSVHIKADVVVDTGCSNGITNAYLKSVAITGFPFLHPPQGNLGALGDAAQELPGQIAAKLIANGRVGVQKALHLNIYPALHNAASRQLDDGTLTTVAGNLNHLGTQFIVSGVIRDMAMADPRTLKEKNYLVDLYNRLDYRSKKHLRGFELDLFIHDGFSGALLLEKRYRTQGLWNLPAHTKTGFGTLAFSEQEYGQAVNTLLAQVVDELEEDLRCRPFSAQITRTDNNRIWFNAGIRSGIKAGDKFKVLHRSTFYDTQMRPTHQLSNTGRTLVVDEVQPNFVKGHLVNIAQHQNILPGDVVISD